MKQLTIVCQQASSPSGISEILRKHDVVGTASWSATALYQIEGGVQPEFSEGRCQFIVTVVPAETVE